MNKQTFLLLTTVISLGANVLTSRAEDANPGAANVKNYLVSRLAKMKTASEDFVKTSQEYADFIQQNGSVAAAYKADPKKLDAFVHRMQEDYKNTDSFGYETVEGIVAGVKSMVAFDVSLDSGVPEEPGAENVAPVVLDLGDGKKLDHKGSLFTYLIEPSLWAGDKSLCVEVDGKYFPRPEVMVAAGKEVDKELTELQAIAKNWNASQEDCFAAMVTMTPTFSDYFDDWKESRYSANKSGHFQAVSRVSDMRGIMGSCQVMYEAVKPSVAQKDKALAKSTDAGFRDIMAFVNMIGAKEKEGEITSAEIDELATQAKQKTDKLVPQIEQSAAVVGIKTQS